MVAVAKTIPCATIDAESSLQFALEHCNATFEKMAVTERVRWSLENLPGQHIVTSSFGAQAAVSLHLLTRVKPDIPVVLIDTGYLFPETYRFIDELTDRLQLNLKVYSSDVSPRWQEARFGERWRMGAEALEEYNQQVKVAPMKRAIDELGVGTWFAGLRRNQSESRAEVPFLSWSRGDRWKVHAIADWTDRNIYDYLKKHDLPYHPLWEKGYVSIGDVHTTKSLAEAGSAEGTRFFGLTRECGLHDIDMSEVFLP